MYELQWRVFIKMTKPKPEIELSNNKRKTWRCWNCEYEVFEEIGDSKHKKCPKCGKQMELRGFFHKTIIINASDKLSSIGITEINFRGEEEILITIENLRIGYVAPIIISEEDWKKIKNFS